MKRAIASLILTIGLTTPSLAQQSGALLAGQAAQNASDFAAAGPLYLRASHGQPNNLSLVNQALSALVASGDMDQAIHLSKAIEDAGAATPISNLVNWAALIAADDYAAVQTMMAKTPIVGQAVDALLDGWTLIDRGEIELALARFDEAAVQEDMRRFANYQKAVALAHLGRWDDAKAALGDPQGTQAIAVSAAILAVNGDIDGAKSMLDPIRQADLSRWLLARLNDGETPALWPTTAKEGVAEVLFQIANSLHGDGDEDILLIYTRLARMIHPNHIPAIYMSGQLLRDVDNNPLAVIALEQVPDDHHLANAAKILLGNAQWDLESRDVALETLIANAKLHKSTPRAHRALGDMYRRDKNYRQAAKSYGRAINLSEDEGQQDWWSHYTRAISYERLGRWRWAEADFRTALEYRPDEARVLNYLGYSLVVRREKLKEALDMIQKAVNLRPDAGYIIDSLGWAKFKLGMYEDAVPDMEKAVSSMAVDPIVNDHLGDVYWAVGRKIEARFQWKRALDFVTDDTDLEELDPDRIQRKLSDGLDKVLADEGTPLKVR